MRAFIFIEGEVLGSDVFSLSLLSFLVFSPMIYVMDFSFPVIYIYTYICEGFFLAFSSSFFAHMIILFSLVKISQEIFPFRLSSPRGDSMCGQFVFVHCHLYKPTDFQ